MSSRIFEFFQIICVNQIASPLTNESGDNRHHGTGDAPFTVQWHMHIPNCPSHLEQILASPDAWDKERGTRGCSIPVFSTLKTPL